MKTHKNESVTSHLKTIFVSILLFMVMSFQTYLLLKNDWYVRQSGHISFFDFSLVLQVVCSLSLIFVSVMISVRERNNLLVFSGIINSLLMFSVSYACLYEITGLYSTHCAASDILCQTLPTHEGFNMLYFSITTLMTLGVGDYIPAGNISKILVETESITGYIMLAFAIAALTNLMKPRQ